MTRAAGQPSRVLISGAGIAGLTLAYWLHRRGKQAVVIDKAPGLHPEGFLINFVGSGWDVANWMGVLAQLQACNLDPGAITYKDGRNRTWASLRFHDLYSAIGAGEKRLLFRRCDLERVLYEAAFSHAEIRFGVTVRKLCEQEGGVEVEFSDGRHDNFDLVVGADGIHSNIRGLVFGDESRFARSLGYVETGFALPAGSLVMEEKLQIYLQPGRNAIVFLFQCPDGQVLVYLLTRTTGDGALRSVRPGSAILHRLFAGIGWKAPAVLDAVREETPVYLGAGAQIRMPRWSEGRIVLVGDAAHCLTSISGQGAAMAMAGAYILSEELSRNDDYQSAFLRYESRLRPLVDKKQEQVRWVAPNFIPSAPWRMLLHRSFVKLVWLGRLPPVRRVIRRQFNAASIFE